MAHIVLDFIEPIHQPIFVGMGGEGVDYLHLCFKLNFFAKHFEGIAFFDYPAAESVLCLIAHDENDIVFVGERVLEVVNNSPTFAHSACRNDYHGPRLLIERLRLLRRGNVCHVREVERIFPRGNHTARFSIVHFAMLRIDPCGFLGERRVYEEFSFVREFSSRKNSVEVPDDLLRSAHGECGNDELGVVPVYVLEEGFDLCLHIVGRGMEPVGVCGFDEQDVCAGGIFEVPQDWLVGLPEVSGE